MKVGRLFPNLTPYFLLRKKRKEDSSPMLLRTSHDLRLTSPHSMEGEQEEQPLMQGSGCTLMEIPVQNNYVIPCHMSGIPWQIPCNVFLIVLSIALSKSSSDIIHQRPYHIPNQCLMIAVLNSSSIIWWIPWEILSNLCMKSWSGSLSTPHQALVQVRISCRINPWQSPCQVPSHCLYRAPCRNPCQCHINLFPITITKAHCQRPNQFPGKVHYKS